MAVIQIKDERYARKAISTATAAFLAIACGCRAPGAFSETTSTKETVYVMHPVGKRQGMLALEIVNALSANGIRSEISEGQIPAETRFFITFSSYKNWETTFGGFQAVLRSGDGIEIARIENEILKKDFGNFGAGSSRIITDQAKKEAELKEYEQKLRYRKMIRHFLKENIPALFRDIGGDSINLGSDETQLLTNRGM